MHQAISATRQGDSQADFARPLRLVAALTAIYAFAFMDRVILGLLVDDIKADLLVSDTQMGLLLGLAFAGLYALANLPAGYLVDRLNRRALIGAASLAWSGMTLLCAAAGGFGTLFLGRAGVGLAEAVVGPASFSLIRDGVAERFRGTAFSIYAMAPLLGGAGALLGGGALLHAAKTGAIAGLGLPASLHPWRLVLASVGLLGPLASLLLLTFREPPRGRGPGAGTTRQALAHVGQHISVYAPLVAYVAFGAMMSFGQSAWLPATIGRKWAIAPDRIGPMLGGITLVCGLMGLVLTAFLLKRMAATRRDSRVFGAIAAIGTAGGLAGAATAPNFTLSLVCAGIGLFFVGASFPIGATTLSQITPVPLMGRVSAGYLMCQTLLGQALGPLLIAVAAKIFPGPAALPTAFAAAMVAFGTATAVFALVLRRVLARSASVASASEGLGIAVLP